MPAGRSPAQTTTGFPFTGTPERHFVATAFVGWNGRLLLHRHRKLDLWLPCGGHVDPGETPQEAAVREVLEESGVRVELIGDRPHEVGIPIQLIRPRGVQVEPIGPDHEHIDFVFYARPLEPYDGALVRQEPELDWYSPEQVAALPLSDEMQAWSELAFAELFD